MLTFWFVLSQDRHCTSSALQSGGGFFVSGV